MGASARHVRRWWAVLVLGLLILALLPAAALAVRLILVEPEAGAREALSAPDRPGLYQRVLTRPAARVLTAPGGPAAAHPPLPPLSVLYVFDRRTVDGHGWVEIGHAAGGPPAGWVVATEVIDWRQTLTLAFTSTSTRDPALFFGSQEGLVDLLDGADSAAQVDWLRRSIARGRVPVEFPVIAREPDTYIDPNQQFYLLPILAFESHYLPSGHETMLLQVAAVTLEEGASDLLAGAADASTGSSLEDSADGVPVARAAEPGRDDEVAALRSDYRAGVVFVIDTTLSMGPYIERTRAAIQRIYDQLRGSPLGGRLSFGLVAFRDNVEAAPGLGYVSQIGATLADGQDAATFQERIAGVAETRVSSRDFTEDAFAGVQDAIERIDWSGYDARYIVLVTDADARDAQDPLGRTGLSAERLRLLAQEKDQAGGSKIAIAVLHLKTPPGRATHARATRQYRVLSRWGDAGDLYFPVEGGAVEAFGIQVDTLADTLLTQLQSAAEGRLVTVPEGPDVDPVVRQTALVGRAMQLAYLGRATGSRAPRLIEAWVADRDLLQHAQKTLEVRVMLSKNQLSNLQETLEAIFAAGEQTFMGAQDFFEQLRGAAAALARDPDRVNQVEVKRLADVGVVGVWLEGLPYTSQIMNLTEARWLARSYAEQQEVFDVIEEKLRLYRRIHDETDRWIPLSPEAPPGEAVTTMPLDSLP